MIDWDKLLTDYPDVEEAFSRSELTDFNGQAMQTLLDTESVIDQAGNVIGVASDFAWGDDISGWDEFTEEGLDFLRQALEGDPDALDAFVEDHGMAHLGSLWVLSRNGHGHGLWAEDASGVALDEFADRSNVSVILWPDTEDMNDISWAEWDGDWAGELTG